MAQQAELFPEPAVVVRPSGVRGEPRLWVRRLVIWEKPDSIIRDIRLRRGLNIVWSPDPGVDSAVVGRSDSSGHGAGKTLFCRLLRYCLGEDTFANDDLRRSAAEQLPAGLAGIEVVVSPNISRASVTKAASERLNICIKTCSGRKESGFCYDRVYRRSV